MTFPELTDERSFSNTRFNRPLPALWFAAWCLVCVLLRPLTAAETETSSGIPDLLKGEGPSPEEVVGKSDWYLHFYGTRGWIYGHLTAEANKARQLMITQIASDSAVRRQLKVGDVILGVNGKPFDKHPVYQFREYSHPAQEKEAGLTLTLWRKGWEEPREITIVPQDGRPDFTRGETIDLTKEGMPVDRNLGATGARGWIYGKLPRAHQILITAVHQGSPADGVLKKGDVILGVDTEMFVSDARRAFGEALTRAETPEQAGKLNLIRWRDGKTDPVTIQLAVVGTYSQTAPWDCPKSRKIVADACSYLARRDDLPVIGIQRIVRSLALMSTGEDKYMPFVREHIDALLAEVEAAGEGLPVGAYPSWSWAYANLLLCEYYLLTEDQRVLPAIRQYSNALARGQAVSGTWGHGMARLDPITGSSHGTLGGYGTMNQVSTICWMSLLLSERCGVRNDEIAAAINNAHAFLSYFVDIGTVTYGDNLSGGLKHDDNGKTSAAAVAFAMLGDKIGTDFFGRMTVASHAVREEGHTGNYWSFLWGPLGAAAVGPEACSAFLRQELWRYDLERRFDGGFEYQGKIGMGNGYDPATGRQRSMSEHTTPHWDTTGARILMYCLPRKKLTITGRGIKGESLTEAQIKNCIDAGTIPKDGNVANKFNERPVSELMTLLGSWSPVVRRQAAMALAKKKGNYVPQLRAMLKSTDRYAQYGACAALKQLGPKAEAAVEDLIGLLETDDRVLRISAIQALGTSDDMRAVNALIAMAGKDFPDDTFGIYHRYIADSLFGARNSLIEKARSVENRELLMGAARRFLRSPTGHCRTVVAQNLATSFSLQDLKDLWPDLEHAFYKPATTYNTAIQMRVLELMAEYRINEGVDRCVWYLTNMRQHGSEKRVPQVLEILCRYGTDAKTAIPGLEKVAVYFENDEQGFPKHLSRQKAEAVRDTIRSLEKLAAQEEKSRALISIDNGWQ